MEEFQLANINIKYAQRSKLPKLKKQRALNPNSHRNFADSRSPRLTNMYGAIIILSTANWKKDKLTNVYGPKIQKRQVLSKS